MSDFKEEIKTLTDEEKSNLYVDILRKYLHSGTASTRDEITKEIWSNKKYRLSPDEITAISTLTAEMTRYQASRSILLL